VELEKIFDIDGFNLRSSKMEAVDKISRLSETHHQGNDGEHHNDCTDDCNAHDHHHDHSHDHEHASEDIKYYFFESSEPFNYRQLEINLGELLWENETIKVLRMKGLIDIEGDEYMYSLQGVEDIFEVKKTTIKW
jgi:G3E family GTPase